jgi:hypothetical protein
VVHHLGQLAVRSGRGHVGRGGVDRREVDVLPGGRGPVLVAGDGGDHGDLVGGDAALGERGGQRRQVLQRPPAADRLTRRRRR